jgi:hypothetical protein
MTNLVVVKAGKLTVRFPADKDKNGPKAKGLKIVAGLGEVFEFDEKLFGGRDLMKKLIAAGSVRKADSKDVVKWAARLKAQGKATPAFITNSLPKEVEQKPGKETKGGDKTRGLGEDKDDKAEEKPEDEEKDGSEETPLSGEKPGKNKDK